MAKIIPSALVDRFSGSVKGGTVLRNWKGIGVMASHPGTRQPRSAQQQLVRGIMNTLAGDWDALTATTKLLWAKFASLSPQKMSGMNAFIKLNANLRRYIGVAAQIINPPPGPGTPEALVGFAVTGTDSNTNTVSWTTPTGAADYVIVDYSFQAGRSDAAHPRWSFAAGKSASGATIAIDHSFPVGTVMSFRGRVMDSYGRISPNTVSTVITVAA